MLRNQEERHAELAEASLPRHLEWSTRRGRCFGKLSMTFWKRFQQNLNTLSIKCPRYRNYVLLSGRVGKLARSIAHQRIHDVLGRAAYRASSYEVVVPQQLARGAIITIHHDVGLIGGPQAPASTPVAKAAPSLIGLLICTVAVSPASTGIAAALDAVPFLKPAYSQNIDCVHYSNWALTFRRAVPERCHLKFYSPGN